MNRWAAAMVVLGACGGVMVSVVFTYADNILKSFAVGLSIVLSALASALLFGVACSPQAAAGIGLVVFASILYHTEETRERVADEATATGADEPMQEQRQRLVSLGGEPEASARRQG